MILKKVRIENFKQFNGAHEIEFNADGKLTIVYGFNGYGKTRLHSFFHWLFYGQDRDNEIIYNKPAMKSMFSGDEITVQGELTFEHEGKDHVMYRYESFKKTDSRAFKSDSNFKIRRVDQHGNHRFVDNPGDYIEDILPSELSEYFFFDGEGMASELQGDKTSRNHKNLKEAVNTIFGLKLYENAIRDIGSMRRKNNAIYELSKRQKGTRDDKNPETLRHYSNKKSEEKDTIDADIEQISSELSSLRRRNRELSEKIGNKDTANTLNKHRASLHRENEGLEKSQNEKIDNVGKLVGENLSYYIVAQNIKKVQNLISKKVEENYVSGVDSKLIKNLLEQDSCICGNKIGKEERTKFEKILHMLPPHSYSSIFYDYKREAEDKLSNSDEAMETIRNTVKELAQIENQISENENEIDRIDEKLRETKDLERFVAERKENEQKIHELEKKKAEKERKSSHCETIIKATERKLKDLLKNDKHNKELNDKITFLEEVRDSLQKEYEEKRELYKKELEKNIRTMVKRMLSARRHIELNDNYTLSISDSYDSTSLSKGQASVISFAYIGGVLNSLKNMDVEYVSKKYPLILDAPISHLDSDHIDRVFQHLPGFSNQIIIFSKENIDKQVEADDNTKKYVILSNEEANQAAIKPYASSKYFVDETHRRLN